MTKNPFTVGKPVPPEGFVGRTAEIQAAFDQIYNRSHLAIWGGSGMGKSSFLSQLASAQVWEQYGYDPSEAAIVLLSCEYIHPFTASGFWEEVLRLIKDNLDGESGLQTEIESLLNNGQSTKESLRQVLRGLGKKQKSLVLLVDDFDAALRENDQYTQADMLAFVSDCRNLAYHTQESRYLSMIVASLKRLSELGPKLTSGASPWYNHYLFVSLKPFSEAEVDRLLLGIPMTFQLREAIQEITGRHPHLLQIAGSLLYRELRTGKVPDAQAFTRDFESTTRQFFQLIWERSSEFEQMLMMLMALLNLKGRLQQARFDLSGIELIFTQRERELTNLEEQGVVVRSLQAGKPVYFFTSSIMERWVIQEIWNTDDPSLRERQKVFGNLLSSEQVKKLTAFTSWVSQHKNEILRTIEWFGRVSTIFPM
jgi:hypothetical protein